MARRIAYLVILAVAASIASLIASLTVAWMVTPIFLLGYMAVFAIHERWCWRWWRSVHRVVNLTGSWRLGDDRLTVRQTWTRMQLVGCVNGLKINSRMAEWRIDLEGPALDIVAACPDGQMAPYRLRQAADGTLTLQSLLVVQPSLAPMKGWQRDLPAPPQQS